jgi:hypothetical protein
LPSGAGAKTAHASLLLKAGHAQRLGAGTMREMLGEGRPDHVCEGVHSEFQHVRSSGLHVRSSGLHVRSSGLHVRSSGLHTCIGFRRRQSNYAKKHVYVVGRRVRIQSEPNQVLPIRCRPRSVYNRGAQMTPRTRFHRQKNPAFAPGGETSSLSTARAETPRHRDRPGENTPHNRS